jgi:hypothetical protein
VDKAFSITLLFIFVSAIVGIYVKRRSRDRCLKDFHGFQVRIELKDGKLIWGRLLVFPSGLELVYPRPHHDDDHGHDETSYIMLQDHLAQVQAIYRYHDELTPSNQARRLKEIRRTYHPNVFRRFGRWFRNFLNTFRDAINESMGLVMARMKAGSQSTVMQTQDQRLNQMGKTVVEGAANAYDPLYERYIGHKVVAEELRKENWIEHPAILKEYSPGWIELLNWIEIREQRFHLHEIERLQINRQIGVTINVAPATETAAGVALKLGISNHGNDPITLRSIEREGYSHRENHPIAPGATHNLTLTDLPAAAVDGLDREALPIELDLRKPPQAVEEGDKPPASPVLPDVELVFEIDRKVDLCLPRAHALVRHGAELITKADRQNQAEQEAMNTEG